MTERELAQAFHALKSRALAAAWTARTTAATLAVQQDIVRGARRMEALCAEHAASADLRAEVRQYRAGAEAALSRLVQQVGSGRTRLPERWQ